MMVSGHFGLKDIDMVDFCIVSTIKCFLKHQSRRRRRRSRRTRRRRGRRRRRRRIFSYTAGCYQKGMLRWYTNNFLLSHKWSGITIISIISKISYEWPKIIGESDSIYQVLVFKYYVFCFVKSINVFFNIYIYIY